MKTEIILKRIVRQKPKGRLSKTRLRNKENERGVVYLPYKLIGKKVIVRVIG